MGNVAACTRGKLWARDNQYMLRRSPVQEDVNTRALDTEVCKKLFVVLFQKFWHGINFTVSILALCNNTQISKPAPTEENATKRNWFRENSNFKRIQGKAIGVKDPFILCFPINP